MDLALNLRGLRQLGMRLSWRVVSCLWMALLSDLTKFAISDIVAGARLLVLRGSRGTLSGLVDGGS